MKKTISIALIFIFVICNSHRVYAKDKDITPNAHFSIAYDSKTGQILYEKNAFRCVPMASTTKILTALVAINYGDLNEKVVISKNAAAIRGSTVGYKVGEEITLRELLFGLMYKSGNDAAIAIAEHIGGSVEQFANMMTDFAKMMGLIDSNFQSPHGLDSQMHFSTTYDLSLLMSKAMENEFFREISGTKEVRKDKYNFSRDYNNINKILWRIENANGGKTGYTGQAGKCLVTSINHKDRNIIIVVLNCPNRWEATEKVYEYIKDKCQ